LSFYRNFINFIEPFAKAYHRLEVNGLENVPPPGEGFIVAPNHSGWFGWDAIVVSSVLKEHFVHWLAWSNEKERPSWDFSVRALGGILYSREKPFPYGDVSENILKAGEAVGIFPEGKISPISKWYRLRAFFPGFARLAVMAGVPVLPCAVAGLEEASPVLRTKEEVGEPVKPIVALPVIFPTKVHVRFGEPMRFDVDIKDRAALNAAAEKTQREVLRLLKHNRPKACVETFGGETVT
jgi:1-acyl-sn-glycerol-3-phosphate acyltransferase